MNVIDAIRNRRSVRAYEERPVEEEKLMMVLEAGRLAPSANNSQDWRYIIVTDEEKRRRLSVASNNQAFVAEAPVVIACCAETDGRIMRCGHLAYLINVSISIDHMTLAAVELGLGTCWIGSFYPDQVREILDIPGEIEVVELLTLGYPRGESAPKGRLPIEELVRWGGW